MKVITIEQLQKLLHEKYGVSTDIYTHCVPMNADDSKLTVGERKNKGLYYNVLNVYDLNIITPDILKEINESGYKVELKVQALGNNRYTLRYDIYCINEDLRFFG